MLHITNKILTLTYIYPLKKKKLHRVDSGDYWPTSIKEKIQWIPLLPLLNILQILWKNNGLISSLLKVFAMFELRLSYKEGILDVVSLKFINCKIETALYLKINSLVFDEIITKFVLNTILHHVGMSWIIISNK